MSEAKKRGVALRNFQDAGTGDCFEAGQSVAFSSSVFANYAAAGLVSDAAPKGFASTPVTLPDHEPAPEQAS